MRNEYKRTNLDSELIANVLQVQSSSEKPPKWTAGKQKKESSNRPITLIADHIEQRGICDNKKVKPQEQNAYYQTLAAQKRDRERVMQMLV